MRQVFCSIAVLATGLTTPLEGQTTPDAPLGVIEPYELDSGPLDNATTTAQTVFSQPVNVAGASWLRLYFGKVALPGGSFIRITSSLDKEEQELDPDSLAMWGNTSAYFNGDTVILELVAGGMTEQNQVQITALGKPAPQPEGGTPECMMCGADDRVSSDELWTCRLVPPGCTASVFNEASCLVSAGHCIVENMVVMFDLPPNENCNPVNPPVADQFPIVLVESLYAGIGSDWAVLRPGTNNLGQLPYERYGELRPIATAPVSVGATAALWGYGSNVTCELNSAQQTSGGLILGVNPATYLHDIDFSGGNSGSAIIHNGEIIGVATHCIDGCINFPNMGTRIDVPGFVAAREALCDRITFAFPEGLVDLAAPSGETMRVLVEADTGTPMPGTGVLHVSVDGGPFDAISMTENAPNDYDAVFPAMDCGAIVEYYVSAETMLGRVVTSPAPAPEDTYLAIGGDSARMVFDDDFETDQGWTVTNGGGLTDGPWERGAPITNCDRGNPPTDADGSGQCYITDNSALNFCNSDVDGGSTTLVSPVMDASGGTPIISYRRWFHNSWGQNPFTEAFLVDVSDDGGTNWTRMETVGPTGGEVSGGWVFKRLRIEDAGIALTDQFRIRFIAQDPFPPSVIEAGIDGVRLLAAYCCPWDCDGSDDGNVSTLDLLALLSQYDPGAPIVCDGGESCDFDGNGCVDVIDLLKLTGHYSTHPEGIGCE